jgi:hypothetical protein
MNQDMLRTMIRLAVPICVGVAVTILSKLGLKGLGPEIEAFMVMGSGVVYTGLVKWLETKHRNWGWLLGTPKSLSETSEDQDTSEAKS